MSLDRKDLKIQALLEKITRLTTNYENTEADLRVEVTVLNNDNEALRQEIEELRSSDGVTEDNTPEA